MKIQFIKFLNTYGKSKVIVLAVLMLVVAHTYSTSAATLKLPPTNLGLVGYWSMDEGNGTLAHDFSGNKNNGIITTATWTTGGKLNSGLDFIGNGYVTVANNVALSGMLKLSQSAWVYLRSYAGTPVIMGKQGSYDLYISTAGTLLTDYHGTSGGTVPLNQWVHIAMTYDGSTVKHYVNGVQTASAASSGAVAFSSVPFEIGRWAQSMEYVNGKIDEVRLYNRDLSAAEIKQLYSVGVAKMNTSTTNKNTSGLVGYWTFDGADTSATTATDKSGSGNNGTLVNSPTMVSGKTGQALSFNGSNQYVTSPYAFTAGQALTVTGWLYSTESTATYKNFFDTVSTCPMLWWDASGKIEFDGGCTSKVTSTNVYRNQWVFVAISKPAGSSIPTYYINGVSVGLGNGAYSVPASTPTWFNRASGQTWKGKADDIRTYNRALSAAEIKQLYNTGVGTQVNSAQVNTPSSSLATGLVGYWPFNGTDISGVTAYDRSTAGNNGTLTNGPTVALGKMGQSLLFNGSTQYIQTSSASIPAGGQNYTVSVWFLATDQISAYRELVAQWTNVNSGNSFFLGTTLNTHIRFSDNWNDVDIGTWTTGKWHHLVAVSTTNNAYIYLDNFLKATKGSALTYSGVGPIVIGRQGTLNAEYWKGNIDEVRIYNRALSTSEINQLYLLGK